MACVLDADCLVARALAGPARLLQIVEPESLPETPQSRRFMLLSLPGTDRDWPLGEVTFRRVRVAGLENLRP